MSCASLSQAAKQAYRQMCPSFEEECNPVPLPSSRSHGTKVINRPCFSIAPCEGLVTSWRIAVQCASVLYEARRVRRISLSTMVHNPCDLPQVVRSDALKRIMKLVEQVASHPAAVLIIGETGTGKEMIARSIHAHSLRCNKAWVDVNCAAIPEHLVESELFGYEKGAFSGADAQKI